MKGKFAKILGVGLVLALVLSLSLVMAVPVPAASPADTDVGFEFGLEADVPDIAEWSDAKATDPDAMGSYSVELYNDTSAGDVYVEFVPATGTTLSDFQTAITAADPEYSFWHWLAIAGVINGPQFELRFEDPASTGWLEVTAVGLQAYTGTDAWVEEILAGATLAGFGGNTPDGSSVFEWGPLTPLSAILADVNTAWGAAETDTVATNYVLERVRVEMWEAVTVTCYIDDITVDGTTYELEPIFLDAEYYSVGDTVEVTVPNFCANTDPIRINPVTADDADGTGITDWKVTVASTSDTGTTVALVETGANTGVFTCSFNTVGTTPAGEDELYVEDGDTITVTYAAAGDWGTGEVQTTDLTLTALVDDTAPTITGLTPADGATTEDATPAIGASYSDPAGIDETSVEMLVDGVDVTDDATVNGSLSYTPTEDMVEGTHDVTVSVSDNAGNEATESWSFRIVSWLVDPVSDTGVSELDELDTVGVAVSIAGTTGDITVGRYASNPEPDAALTFSLIENGFFDVQVTNITGTATQIVIKFADDNITAESTAYVWGELEGEWLECSDQGYNSLNEYLWVKVRDDTTPSITELTGTPFGISGVPADDILAYYRGLGEDPNVVETTDLLQAANDWANEVVPPSFTEPISTTQLLALANEWAATD